MKRFLFMAFLMLAAAQARATSDRGSVTNLPLPRYVSLKVDEAFVRRGPSKTHRIDWVLTRRNMPLMITAIAIFVLHRLSREVHWRDVGASLATLHPAALLAALDDPELAGTADDVLSDLEMFGTTGRSSPDH